MVGYLKSNFDNMWKLCTKEMFYEIANSEAVAKAIAAVRSGDKNAKRKLPAYLFNAKLDEKRYAEYVPHRGECVHAVREVFADDARQGY